MTKKALLQAIGSIRKEFTNYIDENAEDYKGLVESEIKHAKSLYDTVGTFYVAGLISEKTFKAWTKIVYNLIDELENTYCDTYGYYFS